MQIKTPAKINLYLKVGSLRDDGFHDFLSLMLPVALYDTITIKEDKDITIEGMDWLPKEDNLMFKAALLLKERTGLKKGCRISIEKNIPAGGGLGGGSSDCAAVLKGLNELWNCNQTVSYLEKIGAELGSDVNLFLHNSPCIARGRGEIVEELPFEAAARDILIISPGIQVSTKKIYDNLVSLSDLTAKNELNKILKAYMAGSWEDILENDLEETVYSLYPELKKIKEGLASIGVKSMLSGSGSVIFAIDKDMDKLVRASEMCQTGFSCRTYIVKSL